MSQESNLQPQLLDPITKITEKDWVTSVQYIKESNLILLTQNKQLKIYYQQKQNNISQNWELLKTIDQHQSQITCIAYEKSQNLIATGSSDKTVRIYDEFLNQKYIFQCQDTVNCLEFSHEAIYEKAGYYNWGTQKIKNQALILFVGGAEKGIRVYNCLNGQLIDMLNYHQYTVFTLNYYSNYFKANKNTNLLVSSDQKGYLNIYQVSFYQKQLNHIQQQNNNNNQQQNYVFTEIPQIKHIQCIYQSKNYYLDINYNNINKNLYTASSNREIMEYKYEEINLSKDQQEEDNNQEKKELITLPTSPTVAGKLLCVLPKDLYIGKFVKNCNYFIYGTSKGNINVYDCFLKNDIIYSNQQHNASLFNLIIDKSQQYLVTGGIDKQLVLWELNQELTLKQQKKQKNDNSLLDNIFGCLCKRRNKN